MMSHYPPPPPFGGHFPPNAQFIPPPGSAYPAMPHLPYYQMRDPNNQNPTQPVGLPSAQYANTYTFNAVGPNLNGSPSRSGLPQSPYPGFRQTMNGSFLPSPYPPIPPPLYGASSQIPPSSHLRDPGLVSTQFSAGLQPKPPLHSAATADVSIDGLQLPVAAISELEDGELSEAEARESPKDSGSGDPKTSKVSINRHEDSSSLGSNNNREGTLGVANAIQPRAAEDDHYPLYGSKPNHSPGGSSLSHYSQRYAANTHEPLVHKNQSSLTQSPKSDHAVNTNSRKLHDSWGNQFPDSLSNIMKPSQSTSGSRLRRHSSTNEENALSHGYPRQHVLESDKSVRERAKDVLRWMYPHNIDFTTLVEEGINAEVLLELYKEIGIQISPSMYTNEATEKIRLMEPENAREPSSVVSSLSRDQKYNQNRVVAVESSQRNQKSSQGLLVHRVSHEVSNSKTLSDQQLPAQKELETLSNNTTDNGMKAYPLLSAEIRNADTLPKLNAPTTAPKPPHTNQLGKSIPGKTGDKVMERKDYIARMLAAKAGKPIPVASTSTATNVSTKHPTENIVVPAQPEKFAHIDNIEERRLLIENIPLMATEPDFRDFFSGFTIKSITFPPIKPINLSVGRGYVELSSSAEALRASTELSKKTFLNQQVSVQLASMVDKSSYYDTSSDLVNTRSPAKITAINAEEDIDPKDYIDPKEDVDVGLKKRAQTELARQKIEALKSRENGQSEENRKPDGLATSRQTQSSTQPDELIAASQPATVTQRSWQTSSNTENTMKPPFNIPGLFMASSGQVSSASSNQSTQQSSDVILQTSVKVVPGLQSSDEIGYPRNVFPMPGEPKPAADYLTVPQASAVDVQATTGKTTIKEHRKRQRAVDFLDSPTAKVRRTLGQNEDASVIIEVSEEGTDMESEEDIDMDVDMDIDIDDDVGQNTPPTRDVTYQNTGNDKQTNIRDFPQRDEISNKKKSTSSGLNGTPPKVQTPSKSKEPEDLKIKEKEIELMNRKIAELEQRIKAKQTASRAQTPEKSALVKALPKNLAPLRGVHQQVKSTVLDNTLHDKFDDMVEEQNLKKAAELAEAAKEAEAMKLAESAKEDEAKAAAVKESELAQKATIVEAASVTQHERSINEQHATAIEKEQIDTQLRDAQLRRAEEAVRAAEEEQRRFRRAEIESGLPILDAEVERTKNRLLSLKEQVDNLENEVQKGVEGRRVLMEELIGLSSAPKFPIASIERNYENSAGLQTLTRTGDDIHRSPAFSQIVEPIELENTKHLDEGNPTTKSSTPIPLSPNPSLIVAGTKVPTSKRQYDSVDISRMDVDESKITDCVLEYQTKTTAVRNSSEIDRSNELLTVPSTPLNEMTGQADDDDLYEPPATLDLDVENVVSDRKPEIRERPLLETTLPDSVQIATVSEEDNNSMPQISKIANTTYEESDAEDEKRDSDRSVLLAEISDSDDYEPPEPAPLVETPALQPVGESFHRESYLPIQIIDVENESKAMPPEPKETNSSTVFKDFNPQNDVKKLPKSSSRPYKPYESPMKQFKSYRFHLEYLSQVSRGFRSLTFSHGIDPHKPLCQYEVAGGVCNDDSCDGQHIRSMGLSDNMILVQMGAIPEGLSQAEGDSYANGLRQVIQEIRGRKVKDFNVVASEIAAYRAKFLGDNVKVLPL